MRALSSGGQVSSVRFAGSPHTSKKRGPIHSQLLQSSNTPRTMLSHALSGFMKITFIGFLMIANTAFG